MFQPERKRFINVKQSRKNQNSRLYILCGLFPVLFSILLYRLWDLQAVNGHKYAQNYELKIARSIKEPGVRGRIFDCNGEVLAYNALSYTVTMTDELDYAADRERQLSLNGTIYRVIKELEKNHEQVIHGLKIKIGSGGGFTYTVQGKELARFKADIFGRSSPDDMTQNQQNMSADEMMQYLLSSEKYALYGYGESRNCRYTKEELDQYGLPEHFSKEEQIMITGVRYMLSLNSYKKYVPVVLARDVSKETAAFILENRLSLPGTGIGKEWSRIYSGGEAFSHILGYTGKISPEELEQYADKNYTADSYAGKAGIEQYCEGQLKGTDGERRIMVNNVGKTVGEGQVIQEASAGRDVYLSIDKNLQTEVYRILERNLAGILVKNLIPAKKFDKSAVADASDIRIPVYDVYLALIENEVLDIGRLHRADASLTEQNTAKLLEAAYAEAGKNIKAELQEGNTDFHSLPEEMQEYISYIMNETGILDEELINKEDEVYSSWKEKKEGSTKAFLITAIEKGWISDGYTKAGEGYFTAEQMYQLLVKTIITRLENDRNFEKILLKRLVMEDAVTGRDLCTLLYDQKVLSAAGSDYEQFINGAMDSFTFLKKKIENCEITPAQLALDPCSASAAVMDPETGQLLALVSYPGYDLNRLASQMDADYYARLLKDRSLPLYNRASQQLTAPGSAFKPVTIAAGLKEGVISAHSAVFCDGIFDKTDPGLRCWKHTGHGSVKNAADAIQFSCNDYMCETAYRLGTQKGTEYTDSVSLERLQYYSKLFCLDKKSGIEITESAPQVTDAYAIPSAIGQGTHNYSTVQLARYAGTLASRGKAYSLTLIRGITQKDGKLEEKKAALAGTVSLPDDVWNTLHSGMRQFAKNNAAFKDSKISVAGKTGTAQEAKNRPDHALFIGYAPAKKPSIALAVRIANGYASSHAVAAGKDILEYYFNDN